MMEVLAFGFLILIFGMWFGERLTALERNIGKDVEEVWIGGLPTIAPGDDNPNPIRWRINEHGILEYYRKAKRR